MNMIIFKKDVKVKMVMVINNILEEKKCITISLKRQQTN